MINNFYVEKMCCESPTLIENYDKAINDDTQTWVCHHRKETDEDISRNELIKLGLYYNRPASELIFLTRGMHNQVHKTGKKNPGVSEWNTLTKTGTKMSEETKARQSAMFSGSGNPKAKKVRCIETGDAFGCMKDAYTAYGTHKKAMMKALKTGCLAAGYHWEYI